MPDSTRVLLAGVVSLILGAVGGISYERMQVEKVEQQLGAANQEKELAVQAVTRLRAMNDDAAKKYSTELGRLVASVPVAPAAAPAPVQPGTSPVSPPVAGPSQVQPGMVPAQPQAADDAAKLIDSARAILVTRDGFRGSLDAVRAAMNSEFDALALELGNATPNIESIRQLLTNLRQGWPTKQSQLEAATRQLLIDLGLLQASVPTARPAVSAPAAPAAAAPAPTASPATPGSPAPPAPPTK